MARKVRIEYEGAVYHVMARGNERARIFRGKGDYELFLKTLEEGLLRFGAVLHAYCVMPNHVHMAVETPRGNLSRLMGWFQTTFTVRYNRQYRRVGHLFQGRYRAEVIEESAYGRWLVSYIHLNPIRSRAGGKLHYKGDLKALADFPWSSHLDYAGLRTKSFEGLKMGWLSEWGSDLRLARRKYLEDLQRQIGEKNPRDWKGELEMGLVAGGEELVEKVRKMLRGKGREIGRSEGEKLGNLASRQTMKEQYDQEKDQRNQIWMRVKLFGQRPADLARELGYREGSAIFRIVSRVEQRAKEDKKLREKLAKWGKMSYVID